MHAARQAFCAGIAAILFCVATQSAFACGEKTVTPATAIVSTVKSNKDVESKKDAGEEPPPPSTGRGASGCGIAVPVRVRMPFRTAEPYVTERVEPEYPATARQKGIQGIVQLLIVINNRGVVERARVISGEAMLTAAAINSVKRWKFRPYLLNGEPVEGETTVAFRFSLSEHNAASVLYSGLPFWSETKSKVSEKLVSAYDCQWPTGSKNSSSSNCKKENGSVLVRVTLVNESPDFLSRLNPVLSAGTSRSHPAPKQYVFEVWLGWVPLLAGMPEVKSVELFSQGEPDERQVKR